MTITMMMVMTMADEDEKFREETPPHHTHSTALSFLEAAAEDGPLNTCSHGRLVRIATPNLYSPPLLPPSLPTDLCWCDTPPYWPILPHVTFDLTPYLRSINLTSRLSRETLYEGKLQFHVNCFRRLRG